MPAMSEEASSGSGRSTESPQVDIGSLQHYRNRVGPELRLMRQAQGRNRCCPLLVVPALRSLCFLAATKYLGCKLYCLCKQRLPRNLDVQDLVCALLEAVSHALDETMSGNFRVCVL